MTQQNETRTQIANELRQRADAVQHGPDVMRRRLFNALCAGEGARGLAIEAYRVVADLIEQGDGANRAHNEAQAERDRITRAIKAELADLADQEGATIADERVICALSNGLSRALRIVQGTQS